MQPRDVKIHTATIFQARSERACPPNGLFRWLCSCGHESDYFDSRAAAQRDHDEHALASG